MILLIEDEAVIRHAFGQILRAEGHEVMEAGDGTEALALLDKWRFELVVTDLVLPKPNGFDLASFIRARWPNMPIILISGYISQDAGRILLDGLAHFIQKPVDPTALIATVQRLLPKSS